MFLKRIFTYIQAKAGIDIFEEDLSQMVTFRYDDRIFLFQISRIQEELNILQDIIKDKDSEAMKEYLTKIRKNIE